MQSLFEGAIFFSKVQSYLNELWKGGLPWTANTIKVTQSWMPTKMTVSEVLLDVGKSVEMMTIDISPGGACLLCDAHLPPNMDLLLPPPGYQVKFANIWVLVLFSLFRTNKVPFIKFICRCISHMYLLLLLIITGKVERTFIWKTVVYPLKKSSFY